MRSTVVILLSDKRSGSTMFENELCKHPDINHVIYTPHSYYETHHWLKAACVLEMPKQLFYGNRRYEGYGSWYGARRYLIDCIRGNVPDFVIPNDDKTLIYEGWNALCRKFAQPVFFEKSPQYPHHWASLDLMLNWAKNTEFNVRFIGLVRNPMAVMYSAQELFFTNPSDRQFSWACCYRNILTVRGIIGKESFHLVRYEDLIARPKVIFGEICDFLELDFYDTIGNKVHSNSVNKWREDPAFTLQLHESVVNMAKYFGYNDEDLYNPPKLGIATSERIHRNVMGTLKLTKARIFYRLLNPIIMSTIRRR